MYSATPASTAARSRSIVPILAHTTAHVSFPPQVALVGQMSARFRLTQPITVDFEYDDGGKIIVSDGIFYMFGEGITREQAVLDYFSSLAEYYELLESQKDVSSGELLHFLQTYLQPI